MKICPKCNWGYLGAVVVETYSGFWIKCPICSYMEKEKDDRRREEKEEKQGD